jgi:hypothetical protein
VIASISRRQFLTAGPALAAMPGLTLETDAVVPDVFPSQPADLVKEMVGVSHGNFDRVRELVEARPALAKATWDWGFGDWESAIDAASHVGNRPIAEYLMSKGARPTIFTAAMLGHLDAVKAWIAGSPGVQRTRGPHGITLLAHARAGGAQAALVAGYLESRGDADPAYAPAPLSAAEKTTIIGTYIFGTRQNDRLEIAEARGFPTVLRPGGTVLRLVHVGSLQFHPVGAESVRLRFDLADGRATTLTVLDPGVVLTAKRQST